MDAFRKNRTLQALAAALLSAGMLLVLTAWLAGAWGAGTGSLGYRFRYGLHFLRGNVPSFLLAGLVSLAGAWLGIRGLLRTEKPIWLPGILLSLFFTQNTLLHFTRPDCLKYLVLCPGYALADNLVLWCVFFLFYYGLIQAFCLWLTAPRQRRAADRRAWSLWAFAGLIALCWVPVQILRLPGSIPYDTGRQILQYQGKIPWEGANPVFITAVYGFLFSLGQRLGGDNIGLLFCTAAQLALTLPTMGLVCREVDGLGRRRASVLLALFYGLCPLYPSFATLVLKDSVYGPLFLLSMLYYLRVLEGGTRRDRILLVLTAALCALTRKGGVYLSAGMLLCLLARKEARRFCLRAAGGLLAGMLLLEQGLLPVLGVEKPWQRENYSFFYNLTCVYCRKYPQELSARELETIGAVLDLDAVRDNYDPNGIDSVKNTFHAESNAQVRQYVLLNLKFALRHPLCVPETLLCSKGLYFDPFAQNVESVMSPEQRDFAECVPGERAHFSYWVPERLRLPAETALFDWTRSYPQAVLLSSGTYSWLCLLLLASALYRRKKGALPAVLPVVLALAGLLLTHTNGTVRYAAPVIFAVPMLLARRYGRDTVPENNI